MNLDLSTTIRNLVNIALPAWDLERVLLIHLHARIDEPESYASASKNVAFLINRPDNYLTVWSQEFPRNLSATSIKDWGKNICHHDSCWIDSIRGVMWNVYLDLAQQVNPHIAPRDLTTTFYMQKTQILKARIEREKKEYGSVLYFVRELSKESFQ